MTFNEFQKKAVKTSVYPDKGNNFIYPTLGLAGEAGEVAEMVKKLIRDDDSKLTPERKDLLVKELGDVLWYIAALSHELGVSLNKVATTNVKKLASRRKRGVVKGSGNSR